MQASHTPELFYGPSFSALREAAFDRAEERSEEGIRRILYIESNDRAVDEVATAWRTEYPPLTLEVVSLEEVVDHCYERLFGAADTLDRQQRLRLIEQALLELDAEGILNSAGTLLEPFSQFFADIEAAGIDAPEDLAAALTATDLPERIHQPTIEAYRRFVEHREAHTGDRTKARNERITAVATAEDSLQECYPSVDTVVVADKRSLPSVEAELLQKLTEDFTFIATLPAIHESREGLGTDRRLADVFTAYEALGCSFKYVSPEPAREALPALARQCYVLNDEETTPTPALEWHCTPTTEREVRHVARSIRQQLADGAPPEDIIVVAPGLISYREQFADIFGAYEIPYTSYANKLIRQTHVGEAVLTLLALARQPRTDVLVQLLANPLVDLAGVDAATVADVNRRLPSQDCGRLLEALPDGDATEQLTRVLEDCEALVDTDPTTVVADIEALLEGLALETGLSDGTEQGDRVDVELERRAVSQLAQILDSVAAVAPDDGLEDSLTRVERALRDVRIPAPRQDPTGRVEIMGLLDARGKAYDHVYVVGATADTLPAPTRQPLYFDHLDETVPDLQTVSGTAVASDARLEARYQLATLIASAETAYLTTPETTTDDESVLPSSVLNEVARVTGIDPSPPRDDHGCREDLQRTLASYPTPDGLLAAVDSCTTSGAFTDEQAAHLRGGVTCAAHRGGVALSEHDGHLTADTVEAVFPAEKLSALSPSRLEKYAQCGFKYYLNRGLRLRDADEIETEPSKLDLGDFVHETLYRFFTELQAERGTPVELATHDRQHLERVLLEAAHETEVVLDFPRGSMFYTTWKSHLLAGLASSENNDHHGPATTGQPAPELDHSALDRGFFVRFLDAELERDGALDPAWFETHVSFEDSLDDGDTSTFELTLPDGSAVGITGVIDRIDIDSPTAIGEGAVFDYKTGSTNLRPTTQGLEFQLPLYALAAEQGLTENGSEATDILVDAYFYDVEVPEKASIKGPLSGEAIDTNGDQQYRKFLTDITPQRVQTIHQAIQDGAFHPTVLKSSQAKCDYCAYSDVCDVRYHDRHDVIEHIDDDDDVTAYVADRGRGIDLADRLTTGGDGE